MEEEKYVKLSDIIKIAERKMKDAKVNPLSPSSATLKAEAITLMLLSEKAKKYSELKENKEKK